MMLKPLGFQKAQAAAAGGDVATYVARSVNSTATPTLSVDLSAYSVGEKVIVALVGGDFTPSNYTFNGRAGSAASVSVPVEISKRRLYIYEETLQAGDITAGTKDIVFTNSTARSGVIVALYHTATGSIADTDIKTLDAGDLSVAATQANNTVIVFVAGENAEVGPGVTPTPFDITYAGRVEHAHETNVSQSWGTWTIEDFPTSETSITDFLPTGFPYGAAIVVE